MNYAPSTRHPWYLARCAGCRKFVINSAPKCPVCGLWRPSARAVSFALPMLAAATLLATLILTSHALIKREQARAEEQSILIQTLASKSSLPY
jgi:hypothetical protein